ncbi:MAG: VWA domain-containing protein [Armatimonadota bacterium]|nr:VWA domain-containing protein [Armatimonadota bacterium]MDR5697278.1 VWA domain-containing protein [Armatimonadota bacterium]
MLTFKWPAMLWGVLLVPLLGALYVTLLRRRNPRTVSHTDIAFVAAAASQSRTWRRHLPAAVFGLSLLALIVALARPVAPLPVPASNVYVVLSIDVSRSMLAEDVPPNRMEATKAAALEFVRSMPRGARIGLVTFSSYATLLVPPTDDHERVMRAIESLATEFATAIGDGLLEAVWALPGRTRPADLSQPPPPPQGRLPPATVVLMSDGQSNRGVLPSDAARIARDQQVKVYTVGVGTPEGTFLNLGGRMIWVRLDEETLKEIAAITDGTYYHASSASELRRVYRTLGRVIGWERKPTEVSSVAAAAAAVLLVCAVATSMLWVYRSA